MLILWQLPKHRSFKIDLIQGLNLGFRMWPYVNKYFQIFSTMWPNWQLTWKCNNISPLNVADIVCLLHKLDVRWFIKAWQKEIDYQCHLVNEQLLRLCPKNKASLSWKLIIGYSVHWGSFWSPQKTSSSSKKKRAAMHTHLSKCIIWLY